MKFRGESPMLGLGSEVDVTQVEQTLRRALIALLAYQSELRNALQDRRILQSVLRVGGQSRALGRQSS